MKNLIYNILQDDYWYTFYIRLCRSKISIRWQVIPNRSSSAEKVAIRSHGMKFMQWFNLVVMTFVLPREQKMYKNQY